MVLPVNLGHERPQGDGSLLVAFQSQMKSIENLNHNAMARFLTNVPNLVDITMQVIMLKILITKKTSNFLSVC